MDDQDNSQPEGEAQTGADTSSDAGSDSPSYVTADQLSDFGKDLMGNLRKTMAGMLKTQQPAPTNTPKQSQSTHAAPQVDVAALLRAERATERAIAKHGLNERQGDLVRQLLDVQKPDDANAFIEGFAKDIGATAGASDTQTPTKAAPNPNPTSDRGAPGMTPSIESDDVPVWKWSKDKVEKFIAEKGYREFANVMKQRLPKDLQGVRFQLDDRN